MAEDSKRDDIIKAVTDIEFRPDTSITEIELRHAVKLPFDKLSIAGVALGSLPEAVRTVTSRIPGGETLLRATDAAGNPIPANLLQKFSDGTGLLGSTRINGNFGQVRLHEVANVGSTVTTTVPYNPAMLFAAAALAQINEKLDAIKETQEEMFEFLRRDKYSQQRGDLKVLTEIMNEFKFNWDNAAYKTSRHASVQNIMRSAMQNIEFYRDEARSLLGKKKLVSLGKGAKEKGEKLTESMRNYQLALYLHSFASFLDVLLLGNFEESHLRRISEKMRGTMTEYRELYTTCYNALEEQSKSTLDATLLSGVAFVSKAAGRAIEKTPIGDKTRIDEGLIGAGSAVARKRDEWSARPTDLLISTKENVTMPFAEGVDRISYLYNQSFDILMDGEAIYLLPSEEDPDDFESE